MVATVQDWLKSLGLQEYSERFAANAIDYSVLADLTEQDLRELEIPLGHRRKLLRAIDDMKTGGQPMASEPAHTTPEPERRQISVMFCDLVGSSDLSIRLDPEDMRTIIIKLHQLTGSIVGRRNGTIARYMGDGALVYFGYPNAQEDDTQ
jgi:class 3 adenylate cyclase